MKDKELPYLTFKLDLIKTMASKAADDRYDESLGLRIRELRILRLLHDTPGVSATELRYKLVLEKTLLSKNLAVLEDRGLLVRSPDTQDNRLQRLYLTREGLRAWKEGERIGRALEREMFATLRPEEWQQLHDLLDRALESLEVWQGRRG
jgi:MarR family transcriptional regulator, temperature-dependent positive regulator of motility